MRAADATANSCLSHRWGRRPRTGRSSYRRRRGPGGVGWRRYRTTRPLRCADPYPAAGSPWSRDQPPWHQGIASEHHAGVRAASRHGLNVGAYIVGADGGVQVGGIVDSIHPDRHRHLGAQRIDECIADCADAGWFLSAASENHFGIGALGRCRRNQRRCPKGRRCRGNHQCRGERGGGRQAEDTVRAWCYRNRPHNTIFGSIVAYVTSRGRCRGRRSP